jgi:hypothetical protein
LTALAGTPALAQGSGASLANGGGDSKGSLARRIRSLQKRSQRVAASGGT